MSTRAPIRVLLVEDQATDAELASRALRRAGIEHGILRVDHRDALLHALDTYRPHLILSDFSMPQFDGLSALEIVRGRTEDTPFIFVSGTIGEEFAIECLKRGAVDYVLKTNLSRLAPAVNRALQEVEERRARRAAERDLDESRRRFELFMRHLPDAASIKDREGRYRFVNVSWEQATGKSMAEVAGCTDRDLWPLLAPVYEEHYRTVLSTNRAVRASITLPRTDGEHHYLVRKFPIRDDSGAAIFVGSLFADLTERLDAERKIARLSRIHAVLSGINSAIVRIRNKDELLREACRIAAEDGGFRLAWIGWLDESTRGVSAVAWHGSEAGYLEGVRVSAREDVAEGQGIVGNAIRHGRPMIANDLATDPRMRYVENAAVHGFHGAVALPLKIEGRTAGALVLYSGEAGVFDTEEMKLLQELAGDISFALDYIAKDERLSYLAFYDVLTGLPNTTLFCERVNQMLDAAGRRSGTLAVVVLDLDRFRTVNESLGRTAGDRLLKQVAECMKGIGEGCTVARVGSDQFAAALPGIDDPATLAHLLEGKFCGSLGRTFELDGHELRMSSTAGVSFFPVDGADAATLLANAETALKKAKASGSRYLFYAPAMNARVADRLSLESRLRRAIAQDEFLLHYQPKFDAHSGALAGIEALLRWRDPNAGLVLPGEFIPVLEETGMILAVGGWVLRQACTDYREWRTGNAGSLRIAVNVSALQLRDPRFVESVLDAISCKGVEGNPFDLEITESLLMEDIDDNIRKLKALRDHGIGVVIDDFGTGYSSMSYLTKLPVTALKIDRTFVETMEHNADSLAIVSSIISLAHILKLKVVAEGVETEGQARLLRLLKCEELQGFYFSKPVDFRGLSRSYGMPL